MSIPANASLQTVICTTDIERSRKFYADILGLTLKTMSEGALVFDVGGNVLRVSPVASLSPSEHTIVGFTVDDINRVIARLVEDGIYFERFPSFHHAENGTVTTPNGTIVAWFRDLDGNLLSLVEY